VKPTPLLASLAIALCVVVGAFVAGVAAHALTGASALVVAAVSAAVLAGAFAWRVPEGLVAFAIAVLLADTVEYWSGADLRFVDEVGVPLFLAVGLLVHRARLVSSRPAAREAALAVLFVAGAASSLAAEVPGGVWIPALGLLAKGFAFFYLVLALRITAPELQRMTAAFFVVGIGILLVGLVQFVSPSVAREVLHLPPLVQQRGSLQVVSSVFTHPALYGWLAAFLALFAFARFTVLREWWALGLAVALGAASVLSGRRTPLVGIIAGIGVATARQFVTGAARMRTLATAGVLLGVLAAVSWPLLGAFYQTTLSDYLEPPELMAEILAHDPDASVIAPMAPRTALYVASVAIARDHLPLGAGLGRFGSHMSREEYSPVYATYGLDQVYGLKVDETIAVTDTFWPMVLGETGGIGLVAAVAFFAILGAQLWRASGVPLPLPLRAFVLGALLVYVESLVRSLTSPVFVAPPIAYIAFGSFALALGLTRDAAVAPADG
jgi:hypothetical protein